MIWYDDMMIWYYMIWYTMIWWYYIIWWYDMIWYDILQYEWWKGGGQDKKAIWSTYKNLSRSDKSNVMKHIMR